MRNKILASIICIFAAGILGACDDEQESGTTPAAGYATVHMIDNAFSPQVIRVPPGTRIKFANDGRNPHNAVASDESWSTEIPFGDIEMPAGSQTSLTFDQPGIFPYICTFHASEDGRGMVGTVVVGDAEYTPPDQDAGKLESVSEATGVTRRVPADYPTIQAGVDAAAPGDMVLVAAGVYEEEVTVTTPSITIRGTDRNKVIIDGEFQRPNAIKILETDGVAVENMTLRNATLNGVFWTGAKGYRGSYLTAYNNGDYGIYAFDSVDGVLDHSYASGSPDSGIYIGQCQPCNAVINDVISENNALGYSGTNSGGDLYIINSVWRDNMSGIVPNTLDSELLPPERGTMIVGNLVMNNGNENAPAHPLEYPTFGNGIMIIGGESNRVERNLVVDHPNHGILIAPIVDDLLWTASGNVVRDNVVARSGRADIALGGPAAMENCFAGNTYRTMIPPGLEQLQGCEGFRIPLGWDLSALWGILAMFSDVTDGEYPHGDYKKAAVPPPQPGMPGGENAPVVPAHDVFSNYPLDLKSIKTPALDQISRN